MTVTNEPDTDDDVGREVPLGALLTVLFAASVGGAGVGYAVAGVGVAIAAAGLAPLAATAWLAWRFPA